jgi:hypothetical protein
MYSFVLRGRAGIQRGNDPIDVVHTTAPRPTAHSL